MRNADAHTPRCAFVTNHALVLACLAHDRAMRLREVAKHIGVSERAVQKIVGDLEQAGYLARRRDGRRNEYELNLDKPLRTSLARGGELQALIRLLQRGILPQPA